MPLIVVLSIFGQANHLSSQNTAPEKQEIKENKVKFMASQLLAKFEESTPSCTLRRQVKYNYHSCIHCTLDFFKVTIL